MNQETNTKIIKVAILSSPILVIWASDFLLHIPITILMNVLLSTFGESATWYPPISFILFPLKIAISAVAVYYAMQKWNKHFPPVK